MESSPFIGLLLHREAGHGHNIKGFAQDSKYIYSASSPYGPNAAVIVWEKNTHHPVATLRHPVGVYSLAVDETHLYAGLISGAIQVWQKDTWLPENTFQAHNSYIDSLIVDEKYAYVASSNDSQGIYHITVFDKVNWKEVATLSGDKQPIACIAVDDVHVYGSTGKCLYNPGSPKTGISLRIWAKGSWELLTTLPSEDAILSLAMDEKFIYGGTRGNLVHVWAKDSRQRVTSIDTQQEWSQCIAVDEKYLYTGSRYKNTIQVWDKVNKQRLTSIPASCQYLEAFVVDEKCVYVPLADNAIGLWEKGTWKCIRKLEGHANAIRALKMDDQYTYLRLVDCTTVILKNFTLEPITRIPDDADLPRWGNGCAVTADQVYLYCSSGNFIKIYQKDTWQRVAAFEAHYQRIEAFADDSKYLYSGSLDGNMKVWKKKGWKMVQQIDPPRGGSWSADDVDRLGHGCPYAIAMDEKRIFVAYGGEFANKICVYAKKTWLVEDEFRGFGADIVELALADNVLYARDESGKVGKWQIEKGGQPEMIDAMPSKAGGNILAADGNIVLVIPKNTVSMPAESIRHLLEKQQLKVVLGKNPEYFALVG